MTRRVNFEPQQRVDQPDAQAISSFLVQDIRRIMRQVVMGRDVATDTGRVLAGFKVEPEAAGVSPRVIVKLDLGGGELGAFMGAINQGGGNIDWGQLAGDKDGAGNLEGSAQNILDFTGQPAAVYQVKARTTFVPGILDNRAFWNPASNAEFIKPTNTRLLPQWEIAFQNHSSDEWVLLGEVDWDGAAVQADDVVDLRKFPIEGQPRNAGTAAEQWAHATQNDADTFGVGDFDRNEDRGDGGAGLAAIWEALRALGRQVQDVKGGREGDLRYDWFSRPFAPAGFLAADPSDKSTKHLRSVDVITFTVADGTTEQGDFNGANALNDCMLFVQDNAADLPPRIHVVVKNRDGAADFTWTTPVSIADKSISIVGIGGTDTGVGPLFGHARGITIIDAGTSPIGAGTLFEMTGESHLHLENLGFADPPADAVNWIVIGLAGKFTCRNIVMEHSAIGPDPAVGVILRAPSMGLAIEDSLIAGNIYLGGRLDPGFTSVVSQDTLWTAGYAKNTILAGLVRCRYDELSGSDATERWFMANHLRFQDCYFFEVAEQQTGGFSADGQIDITGCRHIAFERCDFWYHGDQTCLWGTTAEIDTFTWNRLAAIDIHDCFFRIANSAEHEGTITGAGGVNGIGGTGWAIALKATRLGTDPVNSAQIPLQISIDGNRFSSGLELDELTTVDTPADAGCVVLQDCSHVWIERNDFRWWTKPDAALAASDVQSIVRVGGTLAGFTLTGGQHTWISKNYFGDFFESGGADYNSARFIFLDLILLNGVMVGENVISTVNSAGTLNQRLGSLPSALTINTCLSPVIHNNRFVNFRDTGNPLLNTCVGLIGLNAGLRFENNEFLNCGGRNIVAEAGAATIHLSLKDNAFYVGNDNTQYVSAYDDGTFGGGAIPFIATGNHWDGIGSGNDALTLSAGNAAGMISGNMLIGGLVRVIGHPSPGTPYFFLVGYAAATGFDATAPNANHNHTLPMMNLVAGYV